MSEAQLSSRAATIAGNRQYPVANALKTPSTRHSPTRHPHPSKKKYIDATRKRRAAKHSSRTSSSALKTDRSHTAPYSLIPKTCLKRRARPRKYLLIMMNMGVCSSSIKPAISDGQRCASTIRGSRCLAMSSAWWTHRAYNAFAS